MLLGWFVSAVASLPLSFALIKKAGCIDVVLLIAILATCYKLVLAQAKLKYIAIIPQSRMSLRQAVA